MKRGGGGEAGAGAEDGEFWPAEPREAEAWTPAGIFEILMSGDQQEANR